jgi:hypothetical protein
MREYVDADAESFQGFANTLRRTFAIRVKYVASYEGNGGPSGRRDVLYHVHADDVVKFSSWKRTSGSKARRCIRSEVEK